MAARILPYDQRVSPQGAPTPTLRNVDVSTGLDAGLAQAGRALSDAGQAELRVAQFKAAQEEDDARVWTMQRMAQFRAEASRLRRETFDNAPDGWRGAVESVQSRLAALRQSALVEAPTGYSQRFIGEAMDQAIQIFAEETAQEEVAARRSWRVDQMREAITQGRGVLAADPGQWEALHAQQGALIDSLKDLSADQRRDLRAAMDEGFAVDAVRGLIERDARGALRALNDADSGGPFAFLGEHRATLINQAQAEVNRRESEARARAAQYTASLRDTISAQRDNARRGIFPTNPLPLDQVARALGPDVAQAYAYDLQEAAVQQGFAGRPSSEVARAGAVAPAQDASDFERGLAAVTRSASDAVLRQRREDPGGYGVINRLYRHDDLMQQMNDALASGPGQQWDRFRQSLRERGADAVEARRAGVLPTAAPFSNEEARVVASWLSARSPTRQAQFLAQMARAMPQEAYVAAMRQIAPDNPVIAEAGAIASLRGSTGTRWGLTPLAISERILQGQELLNPGANQDREGGRATGYQMPSESELQRTWTAAVGEAYRGGAQEARAYQTFRALYAFHANQAGAPSDRVDSTAALTAVNLATGGIERVNGRNTLAPYGRDIRVGDVLRRDWEEIRARHPETLDNYEFGDIDVVATGNGRYMLTDGEDPILDARTRRPIIVNVLPVNE